MAQLGIVTYNIAKDWDLDTILKRLEALGYAGVELRTTHAHKVEVNLTKAQRDEVRKRFEDSPVAARRAGQRLRVPGDRSRPSSGRISRGPRNTSGWRTTSASPGVKVRPNGIPRGADLDATLRQIGRALHEVGEFASRTSASQIRVEVHGAVTQELENFAKILRYADHPNVYACWNSNPTDVKNGTIKDDLRPGRRSHPRGAPPRPHRRERIPGASCSPC